MGQKCCSASNKNQGKAAVLTTKRPMQASCPIERAAGETLPAATGGHSRATRRRKSAGAESPRLVQREAAEAPAENGAGPLLHPG